MTELIQIKVHKNASYTTIGLRVVEDPGLSWKAKGLHLYLYSRPSGWKIRYSDLLRRSRDGKSSLQAAVDELKRHGYLRISQSRKHGKFGSSVWEVYEEPCVISPYPDFPDAEKPDAENPVPENQLLNNKHIKSKHITKTTTTKLEAVVNDFGKIRELIGGTPFEKITDNGFAWMMRKYGADIPRLCHVLDVFIFQYRNGWKVGNPVRALVAALRDGISEPPEFASYKKRKTVRYVPIKMADDQKLETAFNEAEGEFDMLPAEDRRIWLKKAENQLSGFTRIGDAIKAVAVDLWSKRQFK